MLLSDKKHYTADEFFAMFPESNSDRYELIEGEIYNMASPNEQHQDITGGLYAEIRAFIKQNQGKCKAMISPFDVKLSSDTVVIPDVTVICDPSKLADGKRCNGAPDWIIEVTSSNRYDDLITKYALYQKFGVQEYWIVDLKYQKTLVYYFAKSDLPNIYTFDTPVPIEIYNRNLIITISELL